MHSSHGGRNPAASAWLPPSNVLERTGVFPESVSYGVRVCFGLVSGLFSFGVCFVICGLVKESKNGQALGHNSWGRKFVLALCQVLHLGGGSRGGGIFGTLGATVPCNEHSPGNLQGSVPACC